MKLVEVIRDEKEIEEEKQNLSDIEELERQLDQIEKELAEIRSKNKHEN